MTFLELFVIIATGLASWTLGYLCGYLFVMKELEKFVVKEKSKVRTEDLRSR